MNIRPETPADFAAVARINARAFGQAAEPVLVALLRQRQAYTPALSLVAEVNGELAGHALFTPCVLPLMGDTVTAVLLAPLAVEPDFQRQGLGGALLEAGHAAARDQGASLSFLVGHPSYYPRFGYQTAAFGFASLTATAGPAPVALEARPLALADVPLLMALWDHEESAVDFSCRPEATLLDWASPHPASRSTVFERAGRVAGFARVHESAPAAPRLFLAADGAIAQAMVHWLAALAQSTSITLPLHPASASASALGSSTVQTIDPAMALPLAPGVWPEYRAAVQAGQRPHGRPLWSTAFDLAL